MGKVIRISAAAGLAAVAVAGGPAHAQLVECAQVDQAFRVAAPGGCIGKTLAEQVGAGHGDVNTPGSAVYLIKRDPARAIRRGRQLFQRKFTAAEGHGPRVNRRSEGDITASRALGAGLTQSCAACHGRPRGSAGHGGNVNTFPDSRDAPHLFGLGLIEMLADEVTADLRAIRDEALAEAQGQTGASADGAFDGAGDRGFGGGRDDRDRDGRSGRGRDLDGAGFARDWWRRFGRWWGRDGGGVRGDGERGDGGAVTRRLVSKGIDFGRITAHPDGSVDTSEVTGVDENLRVKPFFHEGRTTSMREFIVGAFNDEMGLQAVDPVLCAVTDPDDPRRVVSPSGFVFDPELDEFNRPPACHVQDDPDGDGISGEIDAAIVDHMEFYLLNYFKPGRYEITARADEGERLMQEIGCTSCHVQDLEIERDRRVADVETAFDPSRGIMNDLFADVYPLFGPVEDGDAFPQLLPLAQPFLVENVFTDLKRHDLGPAFEERDFDGSRITEHVTEPLWGVGSSGPYGHDGRSVTLDAVIRRHGGEAAEATRAYEALAADDRDKILDFLDTLVLFPPDDTASNLNPGDPAGDLQDPAGHGTINLGALFQIDTQGGE